MPRLAAQIEDFLSAEGGKIPAGQALLGSSEVIESVFGSYKQYGERGVWSEIGSNVLLLPVLLVTVTTDLLWRALQAVRGRAVWAWCREHLGKSRQQRFRQVFGKAQAPQAQPAGGRASAGRRSTPHRRQKAKQSANHRPQKRERPADRRQQARLQHDNTGGNGHQGG